MHLSDRARRSTWVTVLVLSIRIRNLGSTRPAPISRPYPLERTRSASSNFEGRVLCKSYEFCTKGGMTATGRDLSPMEISRGIKPLFAFAGEPAGHPSLGL